MSGKLLPNCKTCGVSLAPGVRRGTALWCRKCNYARVKNDPAQWEKCKAAQKRWEQKARHTEAFKARSASRTKRYRERVMGNLFERAVYLKKNRDACMKRWKAIQTDPALLKDNKAYWRKRRAFLFSKCLDAYGRSCKCCGETDERALCLDHVNNDGKAHRKQAGKNMALWAVQNNFPQNLQVLCFNCNMIKAFGGGTMPSYRRSAVAQCKAFSLSEYAALSAGG